MNLEIATFNDEVYRFRDWTVANGQNIIFNAIIVYE